jgi:hypothetical protein
MIDVEKYGLLGEDGPHGQTAVVSPLSGLPLFVSNETVSNALIMVASWTSPKSTHQTMG